MTDITVHKTHKYNPQMAENVLQLYAEGWTLTQIIEEWEGAPDDLHTIDRWLDSMPEFAKSFAQARLKFARFHAELTVTAHLTNKDPQQSRIQIQAAQWLASKYDPATYGEKLSVEVEHKIDLTQAIEDARTRMQLASGVVLEHEELLE